MRNTEDWKPSRYIVVNGKLRPSTNARELAVASRLYVGLNAQAYNDHFVQHCRGRLLDLGCGKVPFYEFYRPYAEEITCVDWEQTLHQAKHVDTFCDLTGRLPFEDGRFDTVLLSDVLEHIPTPQQLLNEIARVLGDGGKLILNVPFVYNLHEVPHDYYRYTRFGLQRLVENAGLRVVVLQGYGSATTVIADTLAKRIVRVPVIGSLLASLVQGTASLTMRVKRALGMEPNPEKVLLPSMYFMVAEKPSDGAGQATT